MKIELIQRGNEWAVRRWMLGCIPVYYGVSGVIAMGFSPYWMDAPTAKDAFESAKHFWAGRLAFKRNRVLVRQEVDL